MSRRTAHKPDPFQTRRSKPLSEPRAPRSDAEAQGEPDELLGAKEEQGEATGSEANRESESGPHRGRPSPLFYYLLFHY